MTKQFLVELTFADPIQASDLVGIANRIKVAIEDSIERSEVGIAPDYTCTDFVGVGPFTKKVQYRTSFEPSALHDWMGYTSVKGGVKGRDHVLWAKEDETPDFWTVYLHQSSDTMQACAVFNTETEARDFQSFLQTLLTLDLPSPY